MNLMLLLSVPVSLCDEKNQNMKFALNFAQRKALTLAQKNLAMQTIYFTIISSLIQAVLVFALLSA
jgi:hypothetical protein